MDTRREFKLDVDGTLLNMVDGKPVINQSLIDFLKQEAILQVDLITRMDTENLTFISADPPSLRLYVTQELAKNGIKVNKIQTTADLLFKLEDPSMQFGDAYLYLMQPVEVAAFNIKDTFTKDDFKKIEKNYRYQQAIELLKYLLEEYKDSSSPLHINKSINVDQLNTKEIMDAINTHIKNKTENDALRNLDLGTVEATLKFIKTTKDNPSIKDAINTFKQGMQKNDIFTISQSSRKPFSAEDKRAADQFLNERRNYRNKYKRAILRHTSEEDKLREKFSKANLYKEDIKNREAIPRKNHYYIFIDDSSTERTQLKQVHDSAGYSHKLICVPPPRSPGFEGKDFIKPADFENSIAEHMWQAEEESSKRTTFSFIETIYLDLTNQVPLPTETKSDDYKKLANHALEFIKNKDYETAKICFELAFMLCEKPTDRKKILSNLNLISKQQLNEDSPKNDNIYKQLYRRLYSKDVVSLSKASVVYHDLKMQLEQYLEKSNKITSIFNKSLLHADLNSILTKIDAITTEVVIALDPALLDKYKELLDLAKINDSGLKLYINKLEGKLVSQLSEHPHIDP